MSSRAPALKTCLNPPSQQASKQKTSSSRKQSKSAEELREMIERNLGRKLIRIPSGVSR